MATGAQVWSQVAATNATIDTNVNFAEGQAPSSLNDSCRAIMASQAKWIADNNCSLVTSGSSTALTVATNQVEASLTSGYTVACQLGTGVAAGATLAVDGLAAMPIQIVPGTNVSTGALIAGTYQRLTYSSTGTGQWIINNFIPPEGVGIGNSVTNALVANVNLTSTTVYADGPSISQGSSGIWFASGRITLQYTGGLAYFYCKLWDGTTVIDGVRGTNPAAGVNGSVSLSGVLASPAGNLKISVLPQVASGQSLIATGSGLGFDSSLTAVRIG